MSELRPLILTQQDARQIGQLLRGEAVSTGQLQPAAAGRDGALVVQLQAAIPAGSTVQVAANIMRLDGTAWVDTLQQIQVRSLTGLAVSTTGRRIAKRVSSFGWCVVET
jgi:hypothetical protein